MADRVSPVPRPASGTRALVGRVLVVEDHEAMVDAFRDLLEDAGYTVRTAGDGVEALAALRKETFSAIVLDLQLPVMDGREFRRRQLEDPAIADVPVLVVTAHPRETLEGTPVLRKPFDADVLLAEIERLGGSAEPAVGPAVETAGTRR